MLSIDATAGDAWSRHLSGIDSLLLEDGAYCRSEEAKL